MKGRYFTIEIDHDIRVFEWTRISDIKYVVGDISHIAEAGFTNYDYKALLF